MSRSRFSFASSLSGQLYLWLAIFIFGAANSVTRKLTEIGAQRFVDGHNPISFCNVLFVGNVCALIVLIIVYGQQLKLSRLRQITRSQWFYLTIASIMGGALAPGLIFEALAITNVNNVVLIGRLEPPLTLALSVWILRERVHPWEIIGAVIAFVGVCLTIFLPANFQDMAKMQDLLSFGTGEILTAIASVALAIATIISKLKLSKIPLGIFNIYRTSLGTLIFFFIALLLYGENHFMEAFSPFLWQWMLIYGPVILVVGQSSWIAGLRATTVSQASLIGSFTPVVAVIASYLILREAPTLAQYTGGFVIFIGIIFSQLGIVRKTSRLSSETGASSLDKLREIESEVGFKGI